MQTLQGAKMFQTKEFEKKMSNFKNNKINKFYTNFKQIYFQYYFQ